jgi:hypothetical protein
MAWMKYTGRTQLPVIPDDCVTVSPRGSFGFAENLSRPEMAKRFCEIAYDPETSRLRLTLLERPTPQTYCFRQDKEHYRLEPKGAMKQWKLFPSEPLLCSAAWVDGSLIIQLPDGVPVPEAPAKREESKPQAKAPRKQRAAKATQTPSGRPYCICAVCGGRYPLVERPSGNYPYGHRVGGKVCPGSLQSPLPLEADYGQDE